MTEIDGFDQPLARSEMALDAQMIALAERPPQVEMAKCVHFAMAFELACGKPIRRTMTSGIKTPKATSTNNLRYVTCKKCLHALSTLATARLYAVLAQEKEARYARTHADT